MTEKNENPIISAVITVCGSRRELESMIEAASEGIIEGAIHSTLSWLVEGKDWEATEERLKTAIEMTIAMKSEEVAEDIIARGIEGITKEKIEGMFNDIQRRLQIRFVDTPRAVMDDLSGRTEARYWKSVAQLLAKE